MEPIIALFTLDHGSCLVSALAHTVKGRFERDCPGILSVLVLWRDINWAGNRNWKFGHEWFGWLLWLLQLLFFLCGQAKVSACELVAVIELFILKIIYLMLENEQMKIGLKLIQASKRHLKVTMSQK